MTPWELELDFVKFKTLSSNLISNLFNFAILGLSGPNEDPPRSTVEERLSEEVAIQIIQGKYICALNLYKPTNKQLCNGLY